MAKVQYEAKGNIRHNGVRYLKGDVVELEESDKKSDLFVLATSEVKHEDKEAIKKAEKAAKKAETVEPVKTGWPKHE